MIPLLTDGAIGALSKDNYTRPCATGLGLSSKFKSDLCQVGSVSLGRSVSCSLRLIAEHEVSERNGSGHLVTEKLDEKRRRKVHGEDLVLCNCVSAQFED